MSFRFDSDDVCLVGFTDHTYTFIANIIDEHFGHPMNDPSLPSTIPFASASELFFLLRGVPDEEFPGGKWATIQHLENLIDERCRVFSTQTGEEIR